MKDPRPPKFDAEDLYALIPEDVRDAVGNILADGDAVTLIKDLEVKGAGQTLKQGTLIKSIRLTGDAQEIDCKYPGIKGLVLRAEFVRKR
ncbi:MAG: alkylphosphonate utilization protein [Erythrobacter sp.]|nr:alkylphosphonate utilization protein [Erythrobacter sp.]